MAGIAIELLALQIAIRIQSLISSCLIPERHDIILDIRCCHITLGIGQLGSDAIGATVNDVTEVREWQTIQITDRYLGKLHWHIAVQRRNLYLWRNTRCITISLIIRIVIIIQFCR